MVTIRFNTTSWRNFQKSRQNQHNIIEILYLLGENQILQCMEIDIEYSITEIAASIGLKGSRTRKLLNELIELDVLTCIDTNKNRI